MLSPMQRILAALALIVVPAAGATAVYVFVHSRPPVRETTGSGPRKGESGEYECLTPQPHGQPQEFFVGLPNPELVLVLSGQMHGYLQPCGCARPQLGGLERRSELLRRLRERGWPVVAVDLGELAPEQTNEQGRFKFETAMQMLKKMDYAAIGMGLSELLLPLDQALGIAQNYQPPYVLAANFPDKEADYPEMFRPWSVQEVSVAGGKLTLGVVGVVGAEIAAKVQAKDAKLQFEPVAEALSTALAELETKKPDLLVLLFQGSRDEGRKLAAQFPQFAVILTRDDSDEPSGRPERVGRTLLISLGHKGKYLGVLGFFRQNEAIEGGHERSPWWLKYELAALTEHYELPDDATNPARELMRDYVLRVHGANLLAESKWPKSTHPTQLDFPEARYVGAATCGTADCHPKPYAIWSASRHSHAFEALEKCGRPIATKNREGLPPLAIGRQYDPECVQCHVTGFDYKTGFVDQAASKHLLGNQCENCHGPASLHVANPTDPKFIKPLQLKAGKAVELNLCRKCHDADNDPKFDFELYWPKVRHPQK